MRKSGVWSADESVAVCDKVIDFSFIFHVIQVVLRKGMFPFDGCQFYIYNNNTSVKTVTGGNNRQIRL